MRTHHEDVCLIIGICIGLDAHAGTTSLAPYNDRMEYSFRIRELPSDISFEIIRTCIHRSECLPSSHAVQRALCCGQLDSVIVAEDIKYTGPVWPHYPLVIDTHIFPVVWAVS